MAEQRNKVDALNIRTSTEIKKLAKTRAKEENRTVTSYIEKLILDDAQKAKK